MRPLKTWPRPVELETSRLRLRPWRDEDYEPFAALNSDPKVMEYFPRPLGRWESDSAADRYRRGLEERGWGLWVVELKGGPGFVGLTGLNVPGYDFSFAPCVEIGWRLLTPFWGKGLATEAAGAALRFGFDQLRLDEIVAFTARGNLRSRSVMERLYMIECGVFDHPGLPAESPLREHVLNRLTRERWLYLYN